MKDLTESEFEAAIEHITSDNVSGAAEVMRRAGDLFSLLRARSAGQPSSIVQAKRALLNVSVALVCAQPEMSPLLRLASAALSAARAAADVPETFGFAEQAALRFVEETKRAAQASAKHAAGLIRDGATILTHSRSSTVLESFLEAKRAGRKFSVIATESRPMLEGRTLAESLANKGIRVTLIADAAASLLMDQLDLVLVGADRVTPDHLINKIGTNMIALAAREKKLPVYAACDSSKFISAEYCRNLKRDQRSPSEIWTDAPPRIEISNRYFEPVSLTCFTAIIAEAGALSVGEASKLAEAALIDSELVDALDNRRVEIR